MSDVCKSLIDGALAPQESWVQAGWIGRVMEGDIVSFWQLFSDDLVVISLVSTFLLGTGTILDQPCSSALRTFQSRAYG